MALISKQTLALEPVSVDTISEQLGEAGTKYQCPYRDILRLRLVIEDMLLHWLEQAPGKNVTVSLTKGFFAVRIRIVQEGTMLSAADEQPENTSEENILQTWLDKVATDVDVSYEGGRNVIIGPLHRRRISSNAVLGLAIFGGLLTGFGLKTLLPGQAMAISQVLLVPLYNALMGILMTFAVPVIFLSLLNGIVSVGDPQQLNVAGRALLARIGRKSVFNSLLGLLVLLPFFPIVGAAGGSGGGAAAAADLIFNLVPSSFFKPFVAGDLLQISVLAAILGVALVYQRERMALPIHLLQLVNDLFISILSVICRFLPAIIFLGLCNLLVEHDLRSLSQVGAMFLACLCMPIITAAGDLAELAFRLRRNPLPLVRKMKEPLLVGLATASSMAAFPLVLSVCRDRLGVAADFTRFAVPMNQVLYKMAGNMGRLSLVVVSCSYFDVVLSWPMLLFITLFSVLSSVVTPPVAGGAVAMIAFLFGLAGLPSEIVSWAAVAYSLADYLITAGHILSNLTSVILSARDLGKLEDPALLDEE